MSIYGIGTDIVLISRIHKLYQDYGDKFVARILHEEEIIIFNQILGNNTEGLDKHIHYLAKAFAAKEAFFKALGTGVRDGLAFKQVCIKRDALGKPFILVHSVALKMMQERLISETHISLSDEKDTALAFVILEKM